MGFCVLLVMEIGFNFALSLPSHGDVHVSTMTLLDIDPSGISNLTEIF